MQKENRIFLTNIVKTVPHLSRSHEQITKFGLPVLDYAGDDDKHQFVEEIEMMKKLGQHKNIVNMIACRTRIEPFLLVVEYVPQGDLLKYLRRIRIQVPIIIPDVTTCQPFK